MKILKTLLLVFFTILNLSIYAQSSESDATEARFGLGIVLGANFAQMDGDNFKGYNHLGLQAGLKSIIFINPKNNISLDLLFSQEGSSSGLNLNSSGEALERVTLNYIKIPVAYNYREWKIDFHLGLAYARLISAAPNEFSAYREEYFKANDFSFLLGATYYINDNWGLTLRYNRSLINIIKSDFSSVEGLNPYNLSFRVAYLFDLKSK